MREISNYVASFFREPAAGIFAITHRKKGAYYDYIIRRNYEKACSSGVSEAVDVPGCLTLLTNTHQEHPTAGELLNPDFSGYALGIWKAYCNNPYQLPDWSPEKVLDLYYSVVRAIRPANVIETGVRDGFSSMIILRGLEDNNFGRLYSIDLADEAVTRIGKSPGWAVPPDLRRRWDLRIGKSSDLLEPLIGEIGQVDLFIHDSDHSYPNVMFEINTVWPHLKSHGVLMVDDSLWNNAFFDFCKQVDQPPMLLLRRYGALTKLNYSARLVS